MELDNNPTHEEIWDDSALINSWNQALEEYKVGGAPFDANKPIRATQLTSGRRNTTASTPKEAP